ncbi:MAG: AsmA family protein [Candidatus Binatia bacterium]
MRKWIIFGVVLLVLVVVTGFVALNLNRLIDRNKDYLLAQIEEATGRNVTVGDIGLTLWGGIGALFKDFSVSDDPSYSREAFIRGAALQVNVKFLPLLRQQLEIEDIVLRRPEINIIRNQKGQFNFSTIGQDDRVREKKKSEKEASEKASAPPALLISLVNIDNGVIHYIDKAQGIDFPVTDLDLRIEEISFDRPIDIVLQAAVFGVKKQNLAAKASIGPLGTEPDPSQLPINGTIELEPVPFANVEKSVAALKQRLPTGLDVAGAVGTSIKFSGISGKHLLSTINGTVNLSGVSVRVPQLPQAITDINTKITFSGNSAELPESPFRIGNSPVRLAAKVASFSPLNLAYRLSSSDLSLADIRTSSAENKRPEVLRSVQSEGTVAIKNGAVTHRGTLSSGSGTIANADYTNLQSTSSFSGGVATIESLSVGAFGGSLAAKGRYDMRDATPRFAATTSIKAMDLTQVLSSLQTGPRNIRGRINLDLDMTGTGKEWEVIEKTLKGQVKLDVADGALLDVNIAESVFSGVLINLIPAEIKSKYPEIFSSKDTEFKELAGSATIKGGRAYTDDLVVSAAEFEARGKGWYAFDRSIDMQGPILFSSRLSQDIVNRVKEMRGLANDQGRIVIPYTWSGKLPGAKPRPDLGYIARAMQKGALQQGFESLFRRRSPKEGAQSSPSLGETPPGGQPRKKKDPTEEILRGLEGLFRR